MSRHKGVVVSGKEPDLPKTEIPTHLYNLLQSYKNEHTPATAKERLMQMLIEAQLAGNLSGKEYARMTELVFTLIILTDFIDEYVPGEYDTMQEVA